MPAENFFAKIQAWADENSHRGRLVRAFNGDLEKLHSDGSAPHEHDFHLRRARRAESSRPRWFDEPFRDACLSP